MMLTHATEAIENSKIIADTLIEETKIEVNQLKKETFSPKFPGELKQFQSTIFLKGQGEVKNDFNIVAISSGSVIVMAVLAFYHLSKRH